MGTPSGPTDLLLAAAELCDGPYMGPVIEGKLTLTVDDLAAGYRDLRGPKGQSWYALMVVLALPVVFWFSPGRVHWLALAPLLFVFFFAVVWLRMTPKALAKKHHARTKPEDLQIEFEFSDKDYRIKTGGADFRQVYSSVTSYLEGKDTFALFSPGNVAQLVPKRTFSAEERAQIAEWLRAAVPPRVPDAASGSLKRTLWLWVLLIIMFVLIWTFLAPPEAGH